MRGSLRYFWGKPHFVTRSSTADFTWCGLDKLLAARINLSRYRASHKRTSSSDYCWKTVGYLLHDMGVR